MDFVQKSEKDDWQTPPRVWQPIKDMDEISLDPCAGEIEFAENNFHLPTDGLLEDWFDVVFVNPPFSEKEKWLKKSVQEFKYGAAKRIYVITPDSTNTSWWNDYIATDFSVSWFPNGRVEYIQPGEEDDTSGVSFGSAVSVIGQPPNSLLNHWDERGDVVYREREDVGSLFEY